MQNTESAFPEVGVGRRLQTSPKSYGRWGVLIGLLLLGGWLVASGSLSDLWQGTLTGATLWARFNTLTTIFLGIFIEAAAFLLLGVLASAGIQVFISADRVSRWVPHNRLGAALVGAGMGLIFPVCECGSVPAARRLMSKGAPLSLGVAFLLAAPVINPVVIASTWVAFGGDPWIVGGRVGLTVLIALIVALVLGFHPAPETLLTPATATAAAACSCCAPGDDTPNGWGPRLRAIAAHSATEFFEMGQFVVLGAFLAAFAQTVVPQSVLLAIGGNPISAVLTMMALAVVLSICSTVDAFVALGFASAFGTGPILAFLVFGPMIDLKAVLLFTTTLRREAVALVVILVALLCFLSTLWINLNVG